MTKAAVLANELESNSTGLYETEKLKAIVDLLIKWDNEQRNKEKEGQ